MLIILPCRYPASDVALPKEAIAKVWDAKRGGSNIRLTDWAGGEVLTTTLSVAQVTELVNNYESI